MIDRFEKLLAIVRPSAEDWRSLMVPSGERFAAKPLASSEEETKE